jgi:hypothetical protein
VAAKKTHDARELVGKARDDLLLAVDVGEVKRLIGQPSDVHALAEVTAYLEEIGYPADIVKIRAPELVHRLREEFRDR